jgi:ketosteroid isomerase-like protein
VSENLQLARSIFAASERGEFASAEWADPEIEFAMKDGPTVGRWTGKRGMADAMRDFLTAWEGYRIQAEGYRELDEGRVVVLIRTSGRGKRSGLEVGALHGGAAIVLDIRDGLVTRFVMYFDRDRAFADLGIEE